MNMKWNLPKGLTALVLVLSVIGCRTTPKRQAYLEEIHSQNVNPAVYAKIQKKHELDLDDIEHLVKKGVSDKIILYHLEETRTTHSLKAQDIDRLREAHVSEAIIDFLLTTPTRYSSSQPYSHTSLHFGFGYPYYSLGFLYGHGYPYGHGHFRRGHHRLH